MVYWQLGAVDIQQIAHNYCNECAYRNDHYVTLTEANELKKICAPFQPGRTSFFLYMAGESCVLIVLIVVIVCDITATKRTFYGTYRNFKVS